MILNIIAEALKGNYSFFILLTSVIQIIVMCKRNKQKGEKR